MDYPPVSLTLPTRGHATVRQDPYPATIVPSQNAPSVLSSVPQGGPHMPLFTLAVPRPSGQDLLIHLEAGDILFVLGPNGTGKSALLQYFARSAPGKAQWICAHRQTWFSDTTLDIAPSQKEQIERALENIATDPAARWKDIYGGSRPAIALADLVASENARARAIAQQVDAGNLHRAQTLSQSDVSPISTINQLMHAARLSISISLTDDNHALASRPGSQPYSVAELSDGERNALLLAANVLTARPGTLLLVDEPERHLHRSIILPLLAQLFTARNDLAIVISTHEVSLPLETSRQSRVLLLRGCIHNGSFFTAWDADLMPNEADVPSDLKAHILGSRRKILFVEGDQRSLDAALYSALFPEVSVVPKSSWLDVEKAVTGLRGVETLHWLSAYGVVDNDRRSSEEIDRLRNKGIYVLPFYSVEAVYYLPELMRRACERLVQATGGDVEVLVDNAISVALSVAEERIDHLAGRAAYRTVWYKATRELSSWAQNGCWPQNIELNIDARGTFEEERSRLRSLLQDRDYRAIIERYPIRETPAPSRIAQELGFQSRQQYERAVLKILQEDEAARELVRRLLRGLWEQISR